MVPGPPQPPPRPRTSPAHFPHNGQYMEVRNPNEPVYEIVGPERMEGYVSETQRLRNVGVDGRTNEYQILFSPSVNMETDYVEMDELRAKSECQEPSTVPAPDQLENALTLKGTLNQNGFRKNQKSDVGKKAEHCPICPLR